MIEFTEVTTNLGGTQVFGSLSLRIERGARTFLLGRSGSGKSQFLRHCNGMTAPGSGTVRIDGTDISSLDRRKLYSLRFRMPLVIQSPALIDSMSIRDNIAYPLHHVSSCSIRDIDYRAERSAASVGLSKEDTSLMPFHASPDILKRASIARALVLEPPVLLLDEPATGLDPETGFSIHSLIYSLNAEKGVSTLVTTHDPDAALRFATEIVFIEKGKVLFHGSPDSIMECEHPVVRGFFNGAGGEAHD